MKGAEPISPGDDGTGAGLELRIVEVDPSRDRRWDDFVAQHHGGSIYHSDAWLTVLRRAYGFGSLRLLCEDNQGGVHGVLPIAERRRLGKGIELSSLPHTPFAGPLTDHAEAARALVNDALARAKAEPRSRLQLKTQGSVLDDLVDDLVDGLPGRPWDPTWVLDLPESPEQIRFGDSRNHRRVRWSVNKAVKLGVHVRETDKKSDLREWYHLYLETMRWHAAPPRPYSFFEACWDFFRPQRRMRLVVAEEGTGSLSRLVAGSIFLVSGQSLFYAFNARRRQDLALRPNDAIHWRVIHDACREGFREYDFGEVMEDNIGLARFKSKWGAEPRPLYRYYHPSGAEIERGMLASTTMVRRLANSAWRRVPLRATAGVGGWMYRHL